MVNTNFRLSGLASGMDTEKLVGDLMKAERVPLDKLKQKKEITQWKRDSYREINRLLEEFDRFIFEGVGKFSTFTKKKVTSSDETRVTAVSKNQASNISMDLRVERLAKAASWTTTPTATTITYTAPATDTQLKFSVTDSSIVGATPPTPRTVNIDIKTTDTLDNVIQKINDSSLGVIATKDRIYMGPPARTPADESTAANWKEVITLKNKQTGANAKIEAVDSTTNTFMSNLGFSFTGNQMNTFEPGQNALIEINGSDLIQQKSNTFDYNGFAITLKNVGPPAPQVITIAAKTDTEGIQDSILKFVEKYNELIDKVTKKLREEKYNDYKPLTDDERAELSDKQIEQWEEKAKSGLLRRDSILSNIVNKFRFNLSDSVTIDPSAADKDFQLGEIGLISSKKYWDESGKIILNPEKTGTDRLSGEDRLKKIIEEDPEKLYKLFMADGPTNGEKGIARRLRDTIKKGMEDIVEEAGKTAYAPGENNKFALGRMLNDTNKQIERLEERLKQRENRYWRQYTAMESAIQKANEQSAYLMGQFGGGK